MPTVSPLVPTPPIKPDTQCLPPSFKRRSAAALRKVENEEKRQAALLIQGKIRQKQARQKVARRRKARKEEKARREAGNYNIRK